MTRDEVAEIVHGMPQGMDADDYLVELVNRALAKRKWVGLEPQEIGRIWADHKEVYGFGRELEQVLKERNA